MDSPIIPAFGLILNRGNDLTEFFWPILYFVKKQILENHQIPLWNNLFLAGTPLVSDPQAPIFYPLNLLALLMPLDVFFILSFIFHITLGAIGMYLCSKKGFNFSRRTSFFLAFFWALAPRLGAYLEAGHVGLIYSVAWIPFALWVALALRKNPNLKHSVLFALSLALIYYSHLPTFLIIAFSLGLFSLTKKSLTYVVAALLMTTGLTAVSLLPQLAWQGASTRYLLLQNPDVYPKWTSVAEAVKAIFTANPNTEKAIVVGIIPSLLAALGFLKLKKPQKLFFAALLTIIGAIILNNASPIYPLLLKQNWYILLRVSTRFWILAVLAFVYLSGLAIEKHKGRLIYFLAILGVLESIFWIGSYLKKPIDKRRDLAPKEVYEYLASDKTLFRVYCLNLCLSQKEAAIYKLELLEGYSTVQQNNFYKHAWGLTGDYWNYYTLSIPPFGANTQNPDVASLGKYNVKYLISKNPLTDKSLLLKKEIGGFNLYENLLAKPRNYELYTPNFIRVKVNPSDQQLVISEVYSRGWKAYLNGKKEVDVQETPSALRAVDLEEGTTFVDFRYFPNSLKYGAMTTVTTVFICFVLYRTRSRLKYSTT